MNKWCQNGLKRDGGGWPAHATFSSAPPSVIETAGDDLENFLSANRNSLFLSASQICWGCQCIMPQIHLLIKATAEVMLLLMFVCIVGDFFCVCLCGMHLGGRIYIVRILFHCLIEKVHMNIGNVVQIVFPSWLMLCLQVFICVSVAHVQSFISFSFLGTQHN